jgi:hypothetical protein
MTINSQSKFEDFFYAENNVASRNDDDDEKEKIRESFDKLNPLKVKYFEHPTSPLISNSNGNSQQMLLQFLKFMQEANMGTTLFKTDENFSDFTRVSYNKSSINNIKKQTCND